MIPRVPSMPRKLEKVQNYPHPVKWAILVKGQLIWKGLYKVFICTKNEQKYFCISALAYKKGPIKKVV
jgi:hypothetical protein